MTTDLAAGTVETNVFSLIWNRRLLVVAFALAFAGVGLLVSELRQKEYTAEASVLLSQPAPTAADPARDEARYVADQVAVMKSLPIAERASEIARKDSENPITVDARDFQRRTLITASAESNFVSVSFHAGRPDAAATGANAIVRAYEEATRNDLRDDTDQALRQLDLAIANAEALVVTAKRSGCEGCRRPRQPTESRARSCRSERGGGRRRCLRSLRSRCRQGRRTLDSRRADSLPRSRSPRRLRSRLLEGHAQPGVFRGTRPADTTRYPLARGDPQLRSRRTGIEAAGTHGPGDSGGPRISLPGRKSDGQCGVERTVQGQDEQGSPARFRCVRFPL